MPGGRKAVTRHRTPNRLRRTVMLALALVFCATAFAQNDAATSIVLGRPTDRSITLSILSDKNGEACVEYGVKSNVFESD